MPKPPETSRLAIASLTLGVMSAAMGFMCPFGIFFAGPGIVCGFLSRERIRHSGGALHGEGLALAGLILSFIGLALWLMFATSILLFFLTAPDH